MIECIKEFVVDVIETFLGILLTIALVFSLIVTIVGTVGYFCTGKILTAFICFLAFCLILALVIVIVDRY